MKWELYKGTCPKFEEEDLEKAPRLSLREAEMIFDFVGGVMGSPLQCNITSILVNNENNYSYIHVRVEDAYCVATIESREVLDRIIEFSFPFQASLAEEGEQIYWFIPVF